MNFTYFIGVSVQVSLFSLLPPNLSSQLLLLFLLRRPKILLEKIGTIDRIFSDQDY